MKAIRKTEAIPEYDETRLIERPNGVYWQSKDSSREYGPFATLLEASTDQLAADAAMDGDGPLEVAETLEEAESEVGICGWFDPDSGELAEEERPRLEEH